ncbi:MAG: hypothetical protein RLZZ600_848, partial [Actinomycetota bacterium]
MNSELPTTWDVVIVGAGPVGQALASLLGRAGRSALIIDKQSAPYALPRAVHYTPDISRLL